MVTKNESAKAFMKSKKGEGTISFVIGVVVLVIVIALVALPIISDATTNNTALTASQITLFGAVATLLVVLIIVMVARAMG